jgi:hypothetical protein
VTATQPVVDVIIPVHDAGRPVDRAIRSVLDNRILSSGGLAVTVVCHNISAEAIAATLSPEARAASTLLELRDGLHSPAGPKEHGRGLTSAPYLSFLDSDDFLEPGALDAWVALAERDRLTAIIPPERHAAGGVIRTPPVRPGVHRRRDAVRDRLAYRSAPLGLLRRAGLDRVNVHFTPGLASGEDQQFTLRLWFSGEPIAYSRRVPAYVVGDDARERVTFARRPLVDETRATDLLLSGGWLSTLSLRERRAIAIKTVRVHLFGAAHARAMSGSWNLDDAAAMREQIAGLDASAPGFDRPFAIADRRLLDALRAGVAEPAVIARLAHARRRFAHPRTWFARDLRGQFAIEGPIRFMAASALL